MEFWGKALTGDCWHNLKRHCVDVAAVLKVLLVSDEALKARIDALSPMDYQKTEKLLLYLACVHDLGKFSYCFQHQRPDIAELNGIPPAKGHEHHTLLGVRFWSAYELYDVLGPDWELPMEPLVAATLAHHGIPISLRKSNPREMNRFFGKNPEDALAFNKEAAEFFLKEVRLPQGSDESSFVKLSWLAAGFFILSDWIGSNEVWFKPDSTSTGIAEYWPDALKKAETAVLESRILPAASAGPQGFHELFSHLPPDAVPSSLQKAVMDLPDQQGPELLILEDLTGGGKTEAAILAAHRALRCGCSQGVFIGLPTMATANAMYARLALTYRKLFDDPNASLILAHGGRALNDDYLGSIVPMDQVRDNIEDDGRAVCCSWFSDNRKKALLAPCGAGTIDQALLGILSSRHQALRLFGLARSFLVVDEVHAYDCYTGRLLANLLTFHAAQGGSAILLSATLPLSWREKLLRAWSLGRELAGADCSMPTPKDESFPLLTRIEDPGLLETPLDSSRTINMPVRCVNDVNEMFQALLDVSTKGGCACWIRNTVNDAVRARTRLMDEYGLPDDKIILFHARFTGQDRMMIEQRVLELFGKESGPEQRAGMILIATQVVEQSLDLDFDLLLSDLAPMELMIQRAGRCHRHERGHRPDAFSSPLMMVLTPDPVDDPEPEWYAEMFKTGQHVYPRPGLLWLTSRLLMEKGGIRLPEDARELVEGAYGNGGLAAPEVFKDKDDYAKGEDSAGRAMADYASLDFEKGYDSNSGQWDEDIVTPTRLGDASRQLRLVRADEDGLRFWAGSGGRVTIKDCMRSEVRVDTRKVCQAVNGHEDELEAMKDMMPDKGRWCELIVMREAGDGVWIGRALNSNGDEVEVRYGAEFGLEVEV